MIIDELNSLYQRLSEDQSVEIAKQGWSTEDVTGEIVISKDGRLVSVVPYVTGEGRASRNRVPMEVPVHAGRSGIHPKPYFLCDNPAYLLALADEESSKDTPAEKRARSKKLHTDLLHACDDDAAKAVLSFFDIDQTLSIDDKLRDVLLSCGLLVFRLEGDVRLVHERPAIRSLWASKQSSIDEETMEGQCAVTGERTELARLFPQITGFRGANSSGAALVSFNKEAFESYGRKQAYNANISSSVAFNSGTALKYLYDDENHKCYVGDTVVIYWADRPAPMEESFFGFLLDNREAEDAQLRDEITAALDSLRRGKHAAGFDESVRFCVLGVSPNAARLSVRFFFEQSLGVLSTNVGQHLNDVEMEDVKPTSLFRLLLQLTPTGEAKDLPSTLVNPCFTAMLNGSNYPSSLQTGLLGRMRADHASEHPWDMGRRAALLKACLVRRARLQGKECEINVALNRDNENAGYLLGRLFAVMEQAQWGALGDTNATIRDRYIGAASTTPARVFQPLLRGCQAHLGAIRKKHPGMARFLERELDEIVGEKLPDGPLPATLGQDDQAQFYIGYYQERVALRKPHAANEAAPVETNTVENA